MRCVHGMDGRFCAICNNCVLKREPFGGRRHEEKLGKSLNPVSNANLRLAARELTRFPGMDVGFRPNPSAWRQMNEERDLMDALKRSLGRA